MERSGTEKATGWELGCEEPGHSLHAALGMLPPGHQWLYVTFGLTRSSFVVASWNTCSNPKSQLGKDAQRRQ